MVLRMVSGSFTVKRNDTKILLLSLLWVIPSILAMSNSSVVVNGIVFTVQGDNKTRPEATTICKNNTARLPLYMSTEIQSKVVQELGDHWIALKRNGSDAPWKWRTSSLTAEVPGRWQCYRKGNKAITNGQTHWMQVEASSSHRVVCEGGSEEGATNSSNVNGTVFTFYGDNATFSLAKKLCKNKNARLPQYLSTEIQSKVVQELGDHWIGLSKSNNTWKWLATVLSADLSNKLNDTGNGKFAITAGERRWRNVDTLSGHRVVCEGGSRYETTTETPITDCTITATAVTSAAITTTATPLTTATTTTATTTTTTAETTTTTTKSDTTFAETTVEPLGVDRMGRKIFKKCTCRCRNPKATPSKPEAVAEKVTELKNNVSVNVKDMTKSTLKRTSRVDKRSSPVVIGWTYLIVVAIPFMAVVFGDILKVVKWFCIKKKVKPIYSVTD